MSNYITDEQGKWIIQGNVRLLIEPSENYLAQRELERIQQEAEANKPKEPTTEERLQMAEDTIMYLLMGGM